MWAKSEQMVIKMWGTCVQKCTKYEQNVRNMWANGGQDVSKIWSECELNMSKMCTKHAQNVRNMCAKWDQLVGKMWPNMNNWWAKCEQHASKKWPANCRRMASCRSVCAKACHDNRCLQPRLHDIPSNACQHFPWVQDIDLENRIPHYFFLWGAHCRSEGFPNGILVWARGLARWKNCRRVVIFSVVGVIWKFMSTFRPWNYIWRLWFWGPGERYLRMETRVLHKSSTRI